MSIVSLMSPQQSLKAFILFTDKQTNMKWLISSMPRVNQEARSVPHAQIEQDLQFLLSLLGLSFSVQWGAGNQILTLRWCSTERKSSPMGREGAFLLRLITTD